MQDLKEIFWCHDNKSSDKWENYIDVYTQFFEVFLKQNSPISLLEIGVQNGGSLEIWKKYFPAGSTFVGLDVNPECAKLDFESGINVFCCDASNKKQLNKKLKDDQFDIIIDDGSHKSEDIIAAFKNCFLRMKPGGLFIIEDLHCSYDAAYQGGFRAEGAAQEFLKNLTDALNYQYIPANEIATLKDGKTFHLYSQRIESIHFYDSIVVIKFHKVFADHNYKRYLTGHHQSIYNNLKDLERNLNHTKHPLVVSRSMFFEVNPDYQSKVLVEPPIFTLLKDSNSYLFKYTKLWQASKPIGQKKSKACLFMQQKTSNKETKSKFKRFCKKWKKSIKKRLHYVGLGPKPLKNSTEPHKLSTRFIDIPVEKNFIIAAKNVRDRFDFTNNYNFINNGDIKFTILITVFDTPPQFLERLFQTLLLQSYQNFEIVVVVDFSKPPYIREILTRFSDIDNRIKVIYNDKNLGISGSSNAGLQIALGDYIAFVDHDDELTWDALQSVVECIKEHPQADVVYSDECIIDENGCPLQIFAKPDWSPMLLTNDMYIAHLMVCRTSLVKEIGGFRSRYDFSQDYDLALRITEKTDNIYHIAKPLYGWRAIATSGAAGGKDYAKVTNILALQSAADRRNWNGKAKPLSFGNRIEWDESGKEPMVSIIIPSDNIENIRASLNSILTRTDYTNYEILVVTNSKIIDQLKSENQTISFVNYDKPFNFSDKCNQGAMQAKGQFLAFFNDDVRIINDDWLKQLVHVALIKGVGAVAPKMLYSNGTIQHAGMVTGVRRLVGTAFHAVPDIQHPYFNMADQIREVSLLCGACLLVSAKTFSQVGGFDSEHTPIAHSDVDLCFKIRELGQTCIYQPDSKLTHLGHLSIGKLEKNVSPKIDKSDIYLLKRWPEQVANDPYFTPLMRSLLYHDSPEDFSIYPGKRYDKKSKGDILIVSHDLTNSGAPRVVVEMAKTLEKEGYFVVITSPEDGPLAKELQSLGFNVIIDSLLLKMGESVLSFARNFDLVIANTVVTWPIVKQLDPVVPVLWYIHEVELVSDLADKFPDCAKILHDAANIVGVSDYAIEHIKKYRSNKTGRLETGFPQLQRKNHKGDQLLLSTFGSYEYRKGQDLLLAAMQYLAPEYRKKFKLRFFGRTLTKELKAKLEVDAKSYENVSVNGELSHEDCVIETETSDLVIVPSRSDTLPIVSIDALGAGVPIMCTKETGTSQYLENDKSGFIIEQSTPEGIAKALQHALELSDKWHNIGLEGQKIFKKYFSLDVFEKNLSTAVENLLAQKRS